MTKKILGIELTENDFDIQSINCIANKEVTDIHQYSKPFSDLAENELDQNKSETFLLFSWICSHVFDINSKQLSPCIGNDKLREYLTISNQTDLSSLTKIIDKIDDSLLKAHLGTLLWDYLYNDPKRHVYAKYAYDCYMSSHTKYINDNDWPISETYLRIAFVLACFLGKKIKESFLISLVEIVISTDIENDFFYIKLIEYLITHYEKHCLLKFVPSLINKIRSRLHYTIRLEINTNNYQNCKENNYFKKDAQIYVILS